MEAAMFFLMRTAWETHSIPLSAKGFRSEMALSKCTYIIIWVWSLGTHFNYGFVIKANVVTLLFEIFHLISRSIFYLSHCRRWFPLKENFTLCTVKYASSDRFTYSRRHWEICSINEDSIDAIKHSIYNNTDWLWCSFFFLYHFKKWFVFSTKLVKWWEECGGEWMEMGEKTCPTQLSKQTDFINLLAFDHRDKIPIIESFFSPIPKKIIFSRCFFDKLSNNVDERDAGRKN